MKGCLSETRWGGYEATGKEEPTEEGQKSLSSLRGKLELYSLLSIFEHLSLHLDGILLLLLLIPRPPPPSPPALLLLLLLLSQSALPYTSTGCRFLLVTSFFEGICSLTRFHWEIS